MRKVEFKDYYATLGVPRDASAEAIKKAFRRLARRYHPDVSQASDAADRMSAVNEAYAVLSDPERRAAYDALGRGRHAGEAFTPPPDWDAGFEFRGAPGEGGGYSDFFAELFGRANRRPWATAGQGAAGAPSGHGEDHHARILLELRDAWSGATRSITLRVPQLDDQGRVRLAERQLEVRIPAGVRAGQLIRLAGQGGPGVAGAAAGDLFLEVGFQPHPVFRIDGRDLIRELALAPWEAALGAVVPVALPDGSTLQVRVPAGAQSGRTLTVRGKGLPGREPGDLELVLKVILPSGHDPRARRHYEAMARELPDFDARAQAAADQTDTGARP